jgi:hypothetical protein
MSISPLASYSLQSSQSSALQALLLQIQAKTPGQTSSAGATGDQFSVSPMAQYLSRAPKEIAAPLQDLVTTRKDVSADLKALQTYYGVHPEERAALDVAMKLQGANPAQGALMTPSMQAGVMDLYALSSGLQGNSATQTSTQDRGKALLAALQQNRSSQGSLLDALSATDSTSTQEDQGSLFAYLS